MEDEAGSVALAPTQSHQFVAATELNDLGLSKWYLDDLEVLGISCLSDLPRLAALAFEEPLEDSVATSQVPARYALAQFGRELYLAFVVDQPVEAAASLHVDAESVEYRFSIDSATLRISAVTRVVPTDLERYLSGSTDVNASTEATGEWLRTIDPLSDLDIVLDDLISHTDHARSLISRELVPILEKRFALADGAKETLEEVGARYGVTRERIRQVESKALRFLRRPWAQWRLRRLSALVERIATELQMSPGDPLIARAMIEAFPATRRPAEPWLRLLAGIHGEGWAHLERAPLRGVDRAIADVLTVRTELSMDELLKEVAERLKLPLSAGLRARISASRFCFIDLGTVRLAGVIDRDRVTRRVRRLNGMRHVLETEGPLHFTDLATRIRPLLDRDDRISDRSVHAWLDRYNDLFVWAGPGTYRVRREGDLASEREGIPERYAPRRRRGIGDAVVALLLERQPRSLSEIESHILARFMVNRGSVAATILQDHAGRFVMTEGRQVYLSDADIAAFEADKPRMKDLIDWNELAADLADYSEDPQ